MLRRPLAFVAALTVLTTPLVLLPAPLASAHECYSERPQTPTDPRDPDTGCVGSSCPRRGAPHHHVNDDPPQWCRKRARGASNACADEPVHAYGVAGAGTPATKAAPALGASVAATDSNVLDCNVEDGVPGDFDGDLDQGVGGTFFGYGDWADDPDCDYQLNWHGGQVTVNDFVFGSAVTFVVGEDDRNGPAKLVDPVTQDTSCQTSGTIHPCAEECGPADDPDDCLSDSHTGTGATCGTGGGDGGYWVFLVSAGGANAPTAGTITAS